MEQTIITLIFGAAMFVAGWIAHAWAGAGRREAEEDEPAEVEAPIPRTKWICPTCQRRRDLPSDLDGKVILCNNCQVRLVRDVERT
jgi:hypothetical protein